MTLAPIQRDPFITLHAGAHILVAGQDPWTRQVLEKGLRRKGVSIQNALTGEEVSNLIRQKEPDLILLNVNLPDQDGIHFLRELRLLGYGGQVIMLSAESDIRLAVDSVRAGACDYITQPFDLSDVLHRIDKVLEQRLLEKTHTGQKTKKIQKDLKNFIAESPPMRHIIETIARIAEQGHSTCMIRGETGVGKDCVAHAIHTLSPRDQAPFVEINCPSFPAHLLENELFGHERGAFTDARSRKEGLLETAHKGTAFLNEIGDIEASIQAKLLQFLESKIFRRIGSTQERSVDVRVIVATNCNLEKLVEEGRFRSDLFYRLNVIPIYIPPLRERIEDIPALVRHFLHKFSHDFSKPDLNITAEALEILMRYNWPGNVRELRNYLERAVLLSSNGLLTPASLPHEVLQKVHSSTMSVSLSFDKTSPLVEQEKRLILDALNRAGWNQSKAARLLRITRDTLRYRMKKHEITTPVYM